MTNSILNSSNLIDPKLEQLENVSNLVRHELRTPITSLQGVLKLLKHEDFDCISEDADRLLNMAILATDRLTRLADALEEESSLLTSMVSRQEMEKLQLENDLKSGLSNQEFSLHYQPIVSVSEDRVVGFEALARWCHPVRGSISPGTFIAIAESSGFIHELGLYLFQQACQVLHAWQQKSSAHAPLTMSINLSSVQLTDPVFSEKVKAILDCYDIQPDTLVLEITESEIISDLAIALETIYKLKNLGIKFYLDDFGTGYSSLSRLQEIPFDAIKIDRSFVVKHDWVMSKAIMLLADDLKFNVIAEGFETDEQLQSLKDLGCDKMQGYFFSKPVCYEKAEDLLLA